MRTKLVDKGKKYTFIISVIL